MCGHGAGDPVPAAVSVTWPISICRSSGGFLTGADPFLGGFRAGCPAPVPSVPHMRLYPSPRGMPSLYQVFSPVLTEVHLVS